YDTMRFDTQKFTRRTEAALNTRARCLLAAAALSTGAGALFVAAAPSVTLSPAARVSAPEPTEEVTATGEPTWRRSAPEPVRPRTRAAGIEARDPTPHVARPERWSSREYEAALDELRDLLPDNAYWEWAAPTRDPDLLGRRQQRNHRLARQRAEIEANLADEEQIAAFYSEQWRDSAHYVAFFTELLATRGAELTERDVGLAKLAIDIHQTRLAWIPSRMDEAIARREAYVERKARWVAAGKPAGLEWDTHPPDAPGAP
ncbi:MAG: hypothetical protein MJE66_09670, partial [Proteobacteria bacterium]|nr:hypothetical protein [Pseudomonadota bacterium]